MEVNFSHINNQTTAEIIALFEQGRLHQSIIFHGSSGIGKSTLVQGIARKILLVESLVSPSLFIVSSKDEKSIAISEIRAAIDWATMSNDKRILLIDDIEKISINGINSLLKLVEEPPKNLYIFMITSKLHAIPITLRSRCLKINISKPTLDEFSKALGNVDGSVAQYLYDVFDGDIKSSEKVLKTYKLDFLKNSSAEHIEAILNLIASNKYDKNLVRILLFEIVKKSKSCNIENGYKLIEQFEYISKKTVGLEKNHLSESAVLTAVLSSSNLIL